MTDAETAHFRANLMTEQEFRLRRAQRLRARRIALAGHVASARALVRRSGPGVVVIEVERGAKAPR